MTILNILLKFKSHRFFYLSIPRAFSLTFFILILFIHFSMGHSAQVTFAWDKNTEQDLVGYRIYYGTSSNNYTMMVNIDKNTVGFDQNEPKYTLSGLENGKTYCSASTAYDLEGYESVFSNELCFTTSSAYTYTLTITKSGTGSGVVSTNPSGTSFNAGTAVTLTATPDVNSTFAGWSGGYTGTSPTCTVTMNSNLSVTATFTLKTYTITASTGSNGSISPSGAVTINHGANQSFTVTPNNGYSVSDVKVDGGSVGKVSSYTFSNVTANHSIEASFSVVAPTTYTISPISQFYYVNGINQITSWQGNLDDGYYDLTLGDFDFQFYGSLLTNIRISTNGYITFGATGTDYNNVSIPNANLPNAIIAPFWDNLSLRRLSGKRGVWLGLFGTAPNRELVIEWYQVPSFQYGTETYSFEIILYESTDKTQLLPPEGGRLISGCKPAEESFYVRC